ncbi:transposase [Spiroplasma ixodetis]|uniref:Transposase n=2 Tax=Spiroplasma ixodetis TaxID=2141 RepID=A0ABN6T2C1_9MOLU|nr:transposase [Spiroplasma ixodetis]BDT03740.1 hypothetical protein SHM_13860 [Spiroplasma ixodetis]
MTNINSYTDEFKKQIVALYQSGKSVSCLAKEYNVRTCLESFRK